MNEKREISKNPKAPELNSEAINLLTRLCFRQNDEIEKVDLIFVLGSTDFLQTSNIVRSLLKKNISKFVLIAGGMPKFEDSAILNKSEAEIILDNIQTADFPDVEFVLEKYSNSVTENVVNGLKLLEQPVKSLMFVNRSQGAGRCYLTLKKHFPNTKILQQVFESNYEGIPVGKDNWFKTEFGRGRVWGEFLRIKKYGQDGRIEFVEVADIVKRIDEVIS
jgi:hypothetical protein